MTTSSDAVKIAEVGPTDEGYLDDIEALFEKMYCELYRLTQIIPLAPGGARAWRKSIIPTLGRIGFVAAAVDQDNRVVGFLHTTLVLLPEYLGGSRAARMLNMYVEEAFRGQGLVSGLYGATREWVESKGATSIEGQVQVGNEKTLSIWKRFGFHPELVQVRLMLD